MSIVADKHADPADQAVAQAFAERLRRLVRLPPQWAGYVSVRKTLRALHVSAVLDGLRFSKSYLWDTRELIDAVDADSMLASDARAVCHEVLDGLIRPVPEVAA